MVGLCTAVLLPIISSVRSARPKSCVRGNFATSKRKRLMAYNFLTINSTQNVHKDTIVALGCPVRMVVVASLRSAR